MARKKGSYNPGENDNPGEDQGRMKTRTDANGQIELTIVETPLYLASEALIKAKAQMNTAAMKFEEAEKAWVSEMKKIKKAKINHKGDIIECVTGRTTEDHARFRKS